MKALDDWRPGETVEIGTHTFGREEILDFARAFDPQPFHLDEAAAARSLFGGLAASGWHVACAWMRLWVLHEQAEAKAARARGEDPVVPGPSPGFDDMRWMKPVLAGTTLRYRNTAISARPTTSRPGWGVLTTLVTATDEAGDEVFRFTGHVFVPRRASDRSAEDQAGTA
jgi:acyl dehydratase